MFWELAESLNCRCSTIGSDRSIRYLRLGPFDLDQSSFSHCDSCSVFACFWWSSSCLWCCGLCIMLLPLFSYESYCFLEFQREAWKQARPYTFAPTTSGYSEVSFPIPFTYLISEKNLISFIFFLFLYRSPH